MSKASEYNDKLKRAIIISVVLHIFLIALLIWSSFDENIGSSAGGGGSDIDAVMVDPGAVVDQYNRQQQQQVESQRAAQQRKKQAQQQAEELQQKQPAEQQRLKEMEKARLLAQEAARQAQEQQKAAEAAATKAAAEAKARAEAEAKKAVAEAKKQAEQAAADARARAEAKAAAAAKEQAAAEAKEKAAAKARAAAAAKADASAVDDLLGGLTADKNAPKQGKSSGAAGQGNQAKAGASGADISNYAGQIQAAIQSRFYDWESFKGRECTLRVRLAPNGGALIDVQSQGGDAALCQAALAAARQANIPKPPTQAVYEALKNAPIDFKPK